MFLDFVISLLMAGTNFVPRLRLMRARVLSATRDVVAKIVARVVQSAIACH